MATFPPLALVDTDVLIDVLRGVQSARIWLQQMHDMPFGVPSIVAMELIMGCRNRAELGQMETFLNSLDIVWPNEDDHMLALSLQQTFRLRSGLSIPDYIIGAMAITRSAVLYTFNVKHFGILPDLQVVAPYTRARI